MGWEKTRATWVTRKEEINIVETQNLKADQCLISELVGVSFLNPSFLKYFLTIPCVP